MPVTYLPLVRGGSYRGAAQNNQPLGDATMSKRSISALSVALFGLALVFGTGSAFAGDGKSCGGKKKDGDTAVIVTPDMPRA